jgi:glutathione S-transferase
MALTFYFGSGSPFAWKVWLALEHKGIAYAPKRLSFDKDETRAPEFLKLNPRGRVPAIVDDGFALYESNAICEYLEDKYPQKPLLPKDAQGRAIVRRLMGEADDGLYEPGSDLMSKVLYVAADKRDAKAIDEAKAALPISRSIPTSACRSGWRSARPATASSARTCPPISRPG